MFILSETYSAQLKWSLNMLQREAEEEETFENSFMRFDSGLKDTLSKKQNESNQTQTQKASLGFSMAIANFDGVIAPDRIALEFVEKEKKNPLVEPKRFADTFRKFCLYSFETCL